MLEISANADTRLANIKFECLDRNVTLDALKWKVINLDNFDCNE